MTNIEGIVHQLRQERNRLDEAIRALTAATSTASSNGNGTHRRRLSAAARARIAAAQRARWARVKAKQK